MRSMYQLSSITRRSLVVVVSKASSGLHWPTTKTRATIRYWSAQARRRGYRKDKSAKNDKDKNSATTSAANPANKNNNNNNNDNSHGGLFALSASNQPIIWERVHKIWDKYLAPVRFIPPSIPMESQRQKNFPYRRRPYSKQEYIALVQRLPWAILLVGVFLVWEETAPVRAIRLQGPSMIPTMAADGSEIWIVMPMQTIWRRMWSFLFPSSHSSYRHNDLVGFVVPFAKTGHLNAPTNETDSAQQQTQSQKQIISCKRIIGLPGDTVQRYGAFVHLYVRQDPDHWGIVWPTSSDKQSTASTETTVSEWERTSRWNAHRRHPRDTIVVPEGHVWVEADCPGMGLDSRQLGPIPMSAIQGRIWGRLWPLGYGHRLYTSNIAQRPHPIPLDPDTLRQYNVHRLDNVAQSRP